MRALWKKRSVFIIIWSDKPYALPGLIRNIVFLPVSVLRSFKKYWIVDKSIPAIEQEWRM
jgi:hypothetical protein